MRGFLKDLERAEREYRGEILDIRAKLGVDAPYTETRDVERYSLAIQLFAGATLEAAISLYAVAKFGGDKHDDHFRWGPAEKRLKDAFHHARITVPDDAEIFELVEAITNARDPIAHPFASEYSGSKQASIESPNRPWAETTGAAGRRAVERLDRFLELLRQHDESVSLMFTMF
jgi:hypothetical protein